MTIENKLLGAAFKIVDLQNKSIQILRSVRTDISTSQGELILDAVGLLRGGPVGNGFLTVTHELVEA